jgi:MOSC domain-containing protein YiiM
MPGRLVGIYTATEGGKPMDSLTEVRAIAGVGLEGDRYATKTGEFSDREGGGRQVTLIAREAITAANEQVLLGEGETRRNLVTEGVDLDALVGREFTVGDVVLVGVRDCPPCSYLQEITRPGVLLALRRAGGLRADIMRDGTLHVGDSITVQA